MIDHTGLDMSDAQRSRTFYERALAPLGYSVLMEVPKEYTGGVVALDPDGHNIEAVCHEPAP